MEVWSSRSQTLLATLATNNRTHGTEAEQHRHPARRLGYCSGRAPAPVARRDRDEEAAVACERTEVDLATRIEDLGDHAAIDRTVSGNSRLGRKHRAEQGGVDVQRGGIREIPDH